jgi:hypothetical protein
MSFANVGKFIDIKIKEMNDKGCKMNDKIKEMNDKECKMNDKIKEMNDKECEMNNKIKEINDKVYNINFREKELIIKESRYEVNIIKYKRYQKSLSDYKTKLCIRRGIMESMIKRMYEYNQKNIATEKDLYERSVILDKQQLEIEMGNETQHNKKRKLG